MLGYVPEVTLLTTERVRFQIPSFVYSTVLKSFNGTGN